MTVRDVHNHRTSTVIGLARARPMNMQNVVCIHIVDCNLNELTGFFTWHMAILVRSYEHCGLW